MRADLVGASGPPCVPGSRPACRAKANRLEPGRYLAYLFEKLPAVTLPDQIDALLPQNLDPADLTLD